MFKIYDGRKEFYQWDIGRQLIVEDKSVTQVHFCNRTDDCSLVVETYEQDGLLLADVPNILLQDTWRIRAYAYDGNATLHEQWYEVKARTKPESYVYTETDVLNFNTLLERVNEVDENIAASVEEYLAENPVEVDLSDYYTKTEADAAISTAIGKIEIPSIEGLASEKYVDKAISTIELTPGPKGEKGDDGYTPVKGVDYFDGKDGADSTVPGPKGEDGYTPVKGVDYWTEADKAEIIAEIPAGGGGNANVMELSKGVVPTEEQAELLRSIYTTGKLPCLITIDGFPVVGFYSTGSLNFGAYLDLFAATYYDASLTTNLFIRFYKYRINISSTHVEAVSAPSELKHLGNDIIFKNNYETPGQKRDLLAILNYLDQVKLETATLDDYATKTYVTDTIAAIELPEGPQGEPGEDYVLTETDKTEIANIVLELLPAAEEVSV